MMIVDTRVDARPALVPSFIAEQYLSHSKHGSFSAGSLVLDLSGFTPMTSALMDHGSDGAETIAQIINRVFGPLVDVVQRSGGFVAGFAGDALSAIYPRTGLDHVADAASEQLALLNTMHLQRTPYGDFALDAKVGIGYGEVQWSIVDAGDAKRTWFFRGPALDSASAAEQHAAPASVAIAGGQRSHLQQRAATQGLADGFYRVETSHARHHAGHSLGGDSEPAGGSAGEQARGDAPFRPLEQLPPEFGGEFRRVVAVFLSLRELDDEQTSRRITARLLTLAHDYRGYFDMIEFSDKGPLALVLFGAPQSHGQILQRAVEFSLAVTAELGRSARVGLSEGIAYAGYIGSQHRATYSVLGETVNLAARIATSARWGAVELPHSNAPDEGYRLHGIDSRSFKGVAQPVALVEVEAPLQAAAVATVSTEQSIFGREEEMQTLRQWLLPLESGHSAGVLQLSGEAGIGKSLLLLHFCREIETKLAVFALRADPILRKSLNPFPALVNQLFARAELAAPTADTLDKSVQQLSASYRERGAAEELLAEVDRTAAALPALLGFPIDSRGYSELDPQARFELTGALIEALVALAVHDTPALLVIEDAHALDEDSQWLLQRIVTQARSLPLAILLLTRRNLYPQDSRADSAHSTAGSTALLPAAEELQRVRLGPISPDALSLLLAHVLGGPVSEELRRFVEQRVGLHPFFAGELARYLADNDALQRGSDGYRVRHSETPIPDDVASLLVERIDALPATVKEVARLAAVIGSQFSADIIRSLSADTDIDLEHALDEGCRSGLWDRDGEGSYRFTQDLLREAVVSMQLHDQLRLTHGRIADALIAEHHDNPAYAADIAFHCEQAARREDARLWLWRAFENARDNFKNARALDFLSRYQQQVSSHQDRLRAHQQAAGIYEVTGQWDRAAETLTLALGVSVIARQPQIQGQLLSGLGAIYQRRGDNALAVSVLNNAIEIARSLQQPALAAEALVSLGRAEWSSGNYDKALDALQQAESDAESAADLKQLGLAHYFYGVVLRDQSRYEEAMQKYRQAHQRFEELGDQRLMTYPLYDMGIVLQYQGDTEQSQRYFEQVHAVYRQIGYRSGISAALLNLGVLRDRVGDFDAAIEYFVQARRIAEAIDEKLALAYTLFSIGATYYKMHDDRKALEYLKDSLKLMRQLKAKGYYGYALSYLVCLYQRLGDSNRAIRLAWYHSRNMQEVGSDGENGRTFMGVAMALAGGATLTYEARSQLAEIAERADIENQDAETFFGKAIETARAAGYVNTLIPALHYFGSYLDSAGRQGEALDCYREALRLAEAAGWKLFVERMKRRYPAAALQGELVDATS